MKRFSPTQTWCGVLVVFENSIKVRSVTCIVNQVAHKDDPRVEIVKSGPVVSPTSQTVLELGSMVRPSDELDKHRDCLRCHNFVYEAAVISRGQEAMVLHPA